MTTKNSRRFKQEMSQKGSSAVVVPGLTGAKNYIWLTAVLAITFIVFIPSVKNGFVTFDDPQYVLENPYIKSFSADNLGIIFTSDANNLGNYHPLTLLSLAANYTCSELDPTSYHVVNIMLHMVNTLLVFLLALILFTRLGTGHGQLLSAIAALLFGIHPLHVESVAWISGRKDLLYTCFYLLALIAYTRYLGNKAIKNYILSVLFFLLSLLSKGMAVTLPLSIIAVDYLYKRDIISKRVILEKIPFFLLSLLFGILAIGVQQAQGATEIMKFSFPERIVFASFGYAQYLVKFLVPYQLCGYYPYPDLENANIPPLWYFSLIPVLLSGLLLVYFILVRPNRKIVFGALFFIVNVVFVLQLFPVGSAVMADRYTYLSSFGLLFLVSLGIGELLRRFNSFRAIVLGSFLLYAVLLSAISVGRQAVWHDSYSFWNDVVAENPGFYPAINNLGEFYENDGRTQEALQMFSNSIEANQQNPNAWFHRGSIYGKSGNYPAAISDLSQAIKHRPGFTQAYINRAIARAMNQDYRGALADLDTVIMQGKNESAYFNRGILKNQLKEYARAIPDFEEAINLNPSCAKCYYSLGLANYNAGMYPEAIKSFTTCIAMDPAYGYAYYYRALSYLEVKNPGSSCGDLQKAVNFGIKEAAPLLEQYCRQGN